MITVDNKFEIGEKAYTSYRVPVQYKCPVCEGNGKFIHNGYEMRCVKCSSTGYLHDSRVTTLEPTEVTIRSIKASINGNSISIKYKVSCDKNVSNRSQGGLFKTLEEAKEYCKLANTKEIVPEF